MLTLKTFITEKSRATLYHGTSAENVAAIIKNKKIDPSEHGHTSTTRDKKYAAAHDIGWDAHFHINHDTLKHHRKIQPTDFHMGGSLGKKDHSRHDHDMRDPDFKRSESEESVKGSIHTKHITHISIHKSVDSNTKNKITKAVTAHAPHIKVKTYG